MAQITFRQADGTTQTVDANIGDSVMRAAQDNGVEGLAAECGGCLTCATCHAYVDPAWLVKLEPASEEEQIMIECAIDVRPTSRLTCQILVTEELSGLVVEIPASQY